MLRNVSADSVMRKSVSNLLQFSSSSSPALVRKEPVGHGNKRKQKKETTTSFKGRRTRLPVPLLDGDRVARIPHRPASPRTMVWRDIYQPLVDAGLPSRPSSSSSASTSAASSSSSRLGAANPRSLASSSSSSTLPRRQEQQRAHRPVNRSSSHAHFGPRRRPSTAHADSRASPSRLLVARHHPLHHTQSKERAAIRRQAAAEQEERILIGTTPEEKERAGFIVPDFVPAATSALIREKRLSLALAASRRANERLRRENGDLRLRASRLAARVERGETDDDSLDVQRLRAAASRMVEIERSKQETLSFELCLAQRHKDLSEQEQTHWHTAVSDLHRQLNEQQTLADRHVSAKEEAERRAVAAEEERVRETARRLDVERDLEEVKRQHARCPGLAVQLAESQHEYKAVCDKLQSLSRQLAICTSEAAVQFDVTTQLRLSLSHAQMEHEACAGLGARLAKKEREAREWKEKSAEKSAALSSLGDEYVGLTQRDKERKRELEALKQENESARESLRVAHGAVEASHAKVKRLESELSQVKRELAVLMPDMEDDEARGSPAKGPGIGGPGRGRIRFSD